MFRAKDDTFILYAALCSGQDTKILTNDLFRDHLFRLVGAGKTFERWLQSAVIRQCDNPNGPKKLAVCFFLLILNKFLFNLMFLSIHLIMR